MKTFLKYAAWLVVAGSLIGVLAFLYLKTQALDPTQRNAVTSLLRDLKQLDADWNVHVLRSKTGLAKNYDLVTEPQRVVLQLAEGIAAKSAGAFDGRLREAQGQLKETLSVKIDLVDQFKAQNAILRNSLRFIPLATEELRTKAGEAAGTAPGKRAQMLVLRNGAEQVLLETLKLGSTSDSDSIGYIRQLIGPLVGQRSDYPPAVLEAFNVFVNHVVTILAQKEREDELLDQFAKLPVVQRIDALGGALESAFDRASSEREKYRVVLFVYSAFLLTLLAFAGWRLRRSYVALNNSNASLVQANEMLKAKVGQRA